MALKNKSTAHAVSTSTGGKVVQDSQSLVTAPSVQETGEKVKSGGFTYEKARHLANMMTPGQRRDILLAARMIQEKEAKKKGGVFARFRTRRPADWITPGQQRDILLLARVIQERDPAGKEAAG